MFTFGIQTIKGCHTIARKILPLNEATTRLKAHIIGVKCVREDDYLPPRKRHHIGRVIIIGVGIVPKTAMLNEQAARIL